MTEHKHADILRAIAEGKDIQYRYLTGEWVGATHETIMQRMLNDVGTHGENQFRIAPETVMVNGVECQKPTSDISGGPNVSIMYSPGAGCYVSGENFSFVTDYDARTVYDALCKPFREVV